jgi:hypothetical protein
MPSWLATLPHAFDLALGATLFERSAIEMIAVDRAAALALFALPFLAGASELLGQASVLAARRIGRGRAAASLAMTGLVYVAAAAVWAASAHLFLALDGDRVSELALFAVISVGMTPRLISVLTVAPYYGELLHRALDAWSMAVVGWGLWVLVGGPVAPALLCAALGWLCSLGVRRLGGLLLEPTLRRLRLATPGSRHA